MTTKKLYYSMGEVAEMFDVTPALIRHWESQFDCIKPHRNKKGNRLFTQDDVDKLKHIYHLVKERGMTLKGANQVLKRGKRDDVAQQMELLERLYRIRASLVEVREELKGNVSGEVFSQDSVTESIAQQTQTVATQTVAAKSVEVEVVDVAEQPRKRAVRRKKQDEDKELFPFYEQSLF
jgi:DNA-binding transcriptional MerR regulator